MNRFDHTPKRDAIDLAYVSGKSNISNAQYQGINISFNLLVLPFFMVNRTAPVYIPFSAAFDVIPRST